MKQLSHNQVQNKGKLDLTYIKLNSPTANSKTIPYGGEIK